MGYVYADFLEQIKTRILSIDAIKSHDVAVITQDDASITNVLEQKLEFFNGLVVVLCVLSQRGEHPAIDLEYSIVITEAVPINRERADFITATELAEIIKYELDDTSTRWFETTHEFTDTSIAIATSKYKALLIKED